MILNSRPLSSMSGKLDDIDALTSRHFLTGGLLESIPHFTLTENVRIDHLTHWNLVKALRNHFWIRCSREYLHTLKQRAK